MSRNLGKTYCDRCGCENLTIEEAPRLIHRDEAGPYYAEFAVMHVSKAHCVECKARYLAWWHRPNRPHISDQERVVDLSYRSTFNDEPGEADLPDWEPPKPKPTYEQLQTENERLRELLEAASCPYKGCNGGKVARIGLDLKRRYEPCQWCAERNQALERKEIEQ